VSGNDFLSVSNPATEVDIEEAGIATKTSTPSRGRRGGDEDARRSGRLSGVPESLVEGLEVGPTDEARTSDP
jgi:hypothetical protein